MIKRLVLMATAASTLLVMLAVAFAPYVYVELWPSLNTFSRVREDAVEIAKGQMFDDYFVVEDLGDGAYAIGEPRYYQVNYSYLIIGTERAILFDGGSGTRDMNPVIASLTDLPVTALPSHLHFDHFNGVAAFERIALVDTERTRAATLDGRFTPGRYEFLGLFDGLQAPSVQVSEWIEAGADIDLGGRALSVISTPGHTAESISLFDAEAKRLFTGDFIYPTMLYAFLPGANLTDYRRTTQRLLNTLPEDAILWGGHCCRRDTGYAAPWLTMQDLRDLDTALEQQANGQLRGDQFFPRRYQVNEQMILGTAFPWNNH